MHTFCKVWGSFLMSHLVFVTLKYHNIEKFLKKKEKRDMSEFANAMEVYGIASGIVVMLEKIAMKHGVN
jgi:hypothetical protein